MIYIDSRDKEVRVSFQEAVEQGLAPSGGLFVPESIPTLDSSFLDTIDKLSDREIAKTVLKPFVEGSLTDQQLSSIVDQTITFPFPATKVGKGVYSLELFHGPTMAFKDVGANFLARSLSIFADSKKRLTVLTATSGDTGSAVANGFYKVDNVDVKVLFPKGKVSPFQEYQMTSLGENIKAYEVDGTFDDCQTLVKKAFADEKYSWLLNLSSANSINVARFLPQMIYYFIGYKNLILDKVISNGDKVIFSVPSGNFGNLTAGVIAKLMGLPIDRFIAANNANDTFVNYLESGVYTPKRSVETYSNAMDVGAPSNFERLITILGDDLSAMISGESISDSETLQEIKQCYIDSGYILDPHGAVGKICLDRVIKEDEVGLFLETASPAKFSDVVKLAIPDFKDPEVSLDGCEKTLISADYIDFRDQLLS